MAMTLDVDVALDHLEHSISLVTYEDLQGDIVNVALECVDCYSVLADEDLVEWL